MFGALYPYAYIDSVFSIDYEALYADGYRAILFDIDNTLVHHGADSTPEIDALLRHIQALGFQTLLLTNNDEERVQRFLRNVDALYVCDADKPRPAGYERAMELLKLPKEQLLCIGDQMFTDILGANRCGIASILVHYLQRGNETKIGKKRQLEKAVLWCYRRNRRAQNRLGDIRVKEGV